MGHGPWAMGHGPFAMAHGPLTMGSFSCNKDSQGPLGLLGTAAFYVLRNFRDPWDCLGLQLFMLQAVCNKQFQGRLGLLRTAAFYVTSNFRDA